MTLNGVSLYFAEERSRHGAIAEDSEHQLVPKGLAPDLRRW
jgi:hypothetical protein